MRNAWIAAIATACVVAGLVVAMSTGAQAWAAEPPSLPRGFGALLSTDQAVYRPGETIRITFVVFNHTPSLVRFNFISGQRYDVVIENQAGKEIWRWSEGRMFTMALGRETLGPAKPRLTYEAEYTAGLEPGRYRIKGLLTDESRRISATIGVEVR